MGENGGEKQEGIVESEFLQKKNEKRRKNDAADADAGNGDADSEGQARLEASENKGGGKTG